MSTDEHFTHRLIHRICGKKWGLLVVTYYLARRPVKPAKRQGFVKLILTEMSRLKYVSAMRQCARDQDELLCALLAINKATVLAGTSRGVLAGPPTPGLVTVWRLATAPGAGSIITPSGQPFELLQQAQRG